MRGRRPAPAAVQKAKGRSHHKKIRGKEPVVRIGAPDMPSHLHDDAVAAETWTRLQDTLKRMKILATKDLEALEGLCIARSRAIQADAEVRKYGMTIFVRGRGRFTNPAVTISRQQWAEVRKFAIEFGLTSSSATKVRQQSDDDDSDTAAPQQSAEKFLFGGRRTGTTGTVLPLKR